MGNKNSKNWEYLEHLEILQFNELAKLFISKGYRIRKEELRVEFIKDENILSIEFRDMNELLLYMKRHIDIL